MATEEQIRAKASELSLLWGVDASRLAYATDDLVEMEALAKTMAKHRVLVNATSYLQRMAGELGVSEAEATRVYHLAGGDEAKMRVIAKQRAAIASINTAPTHTNEEVAAMTPEQYVAWRESPGGGRFAPSPVVEAAPVEAFTLERLRAGEVPTAAERDAMGEEAYIQLRKDGWKGDVRAEAPEAVEWPVDENGIEVPSAAWVAGHSVEEYSRHPSVASRYSDSAPSRIGHSGTGNDKTLYPSSTD